MNRNIIIFAGILILIAGLAYIGFSNVNSGILGGKSVELNGNKIKLEIADSPEELEKGLSGREKLDQDKGMLFVFEKPGRYSFWMKDMNFPLDIIYLSDSKVVTIHKNIPPLKDETNANNQILYEPTEPADKVIEINAGLADKYKLKVGDSVKLDL